MLPEDVGKPLRRGCVMKTAAYVGAALCLATCLLSATHPQEQPELDRTDPVAVAQAYVDACRDGDTEALLSLLAGDEGFREQARWLMRVYMESPEEEEMSFADLFRETQFLPTRMPIDRELAGSTLQDDFAEVTFSADYKFDQKLILKKQPDGMWAVDIIESVKATTGGSETFLAEALRYGGPEGMEGPRDHESEQALRRLWNAMQEYVPDHDGTLPPAERWVDEIELYVLDRSLFKNPQQPELEYGFAMSIEASGRRMPEFEPWDDLEEPEDFVILFEWPTGERNACSSLEELGTLNSQQQKDGLAYITAFGRTDTLPAGITWAQKEQQEQEEAAKMEDERSTTSATYRCAAHLRALGQAARKYARDHGGLLPGPETWQDDIALYLLDAGDEAWAGMLEPELGEDDIFRCPAAPDIEYAYAINAEVAGKNALDLTGHHKIVLFFESDLNVPNAAGLPERDKVEGGRHELEWLVEGGKRGNQVVYLNGDMGWLEWPTEEPEPEE
jgi:hypothetical protein